MNSILRVQDKGDKAIIVVDVANGKVKVLKPVKSNGTTQKQQQLKWIVNSQKQQLESVGNSQTEELEHVNNSQIHLYNDRVDMATNTDDFNSLNPNEHDTQKHDELRCSICMVLYDSLSELEKHKKIHIKYCNICDESFSSVEKVKKHKEKQHFSCVMCDDIFTSEEEIIKHKEDKHRDQYLCDICDQSFSLSSELDDHLKIHGINNVSKKYTCACGVGFNDKSLFDLHVQTQINHYMCEICSDVFLKRVHLKKHVMLKHGIWKDKELYRCIVCDERFKDNLQYKKHLKIHTGENCAVFTCEQCGKKDLTKKALSYHLVTHLTGSQRRHQCKVCKRRFSHKSILVGHEKTHDFNRAFKCTYPTCDKVLLTQRGLKNHISVHEGLEFKCDQCEKVYHNKRRLTIHIRQDHEKRYQRLCPICGKKFKCSTRLKTHMVIHQPKDQTKDYICEFCGKRFRIKSQLVFHMRSHSEKAYTCDVCDEKFSRADNMKLHLRKHTGEKPYKCNVCDKTFSRHDNMKTHVQSQHSNFVT
ncbi:zinc finger protein OZF [Patella vulgata]|uniref:zinc finger protein OZF n=1 Tax=Patella vulgata TaxID=6465 RepID=UPI00217F768D|nr:zinc finger protein OZF [Patella vulgata]